MRVNVTPPPRIPENKPFAVTSGTLTLRGDLWDAADSPGALLFLHGGGQTRRSWRRTAHRLVSAGWSALTVDLRGHGDSDWAEDGDYSSDAMIADVVEVVSTLREPPVIVGASLGGLLAILAEGEKGPLARALVLVDVVPRVEATGAQRVTAFLGAHRNGFASLEEAADAVRAYAPDRARPTSPEGLKKNLRHADGRWYWHWDPAFLPDPPVRRTNENRVVAAAAEIAVPTLAVWGRQSDVVSASAIDELRRLIPQTRVDQVSAGHMLVGDDNDTFASSLVSFLDSV